jgi:hypothetical protein
LNSIFSVECTFAGDMTTRMCFAEVNKYVWRKALVAREDMCSWEGLCVGVFLRKMSKSQGEPKSMEVAERTADLYSKTWSFRRSDRTRCSDSTTYVASKWSSERRCGSG